MSAASYWTAVYWKCFSQPRHERPLYKRIEQVKPTTIVELGLGNASRMMRAIEMANRFNESKTQYCGIDAFELRPENALPLKQAHQMLATTGAKVRLVPGAVLPAVNRTANLLMGTDLLIIDASVTQAELESLFPFFGTMLHEGSQIARFDQTGRATRLRWLKASGFLGNTLSRAA